MFKNTSRRSFIKTTRNVGIGLGVASCGVVVPGLVRGFRFPILQYEPRWSQSIIDDGVTHATALEGTIIPLEDGWRFRASGLNPGIVVHARKAVTIDMQMENIHPDATLHVEGASLTETGNGLVRQVTGRLNQGDQVTLGWRLSEEVGLRFTAIGDTGGNLELAWALRRSADLGADFIIHLGDYYYAKNDIVRTQQFLQHANIPVFSAIGNHDFHEGTNLVHRHFTDTVGPRNSRFDVADLRFVNLDTAAANLPKTAGERNALIKSVIADKERGDNKRVIAFTHMPLTDPRNVDKDPDSEFSHTVSDRENGWVRDRLKAMETTVLLAGHVHESAEIDEAGMQCFIAGEGLAHHDINNRDPIAQILIAEIQGNQEVDFKWRPLLMPADHHCSDRIKKYLKHPDNPRSTCRLETEAT